jgi:hypothetical protein
VKGADARHYLLAATRHFPTRPRSRRGTATRGFTLLALGDLYRLDNLPYVRTLRSRLERERGECWCCRPGIFSSSLLSQQFSGAQMVDGFNLLDGDADAFDPRMFVTFGNHEFEGRIRTPRRCRIIRGAQFGWLGGNISFAWTRRDGPWCRRSICTPPGSCRSRASGSVWSAPPQM